MYRTRFARDIVAEFLPPARRTRRDRVIIVCDGMPSIPRKQPLIEFLSEEGFWAFYPRYRGAWESDGQFLARSPVEDILDIVSELPSGVTEANFGQRFALKPAEIFVIGGSFGGAASLLASLDPRITKVVANCPVVDWAVLDNEQGKETSNPSYAAYIREAFGHGYRLTERNWSKLRGGKFFNPARHIGELNPRKALIFHAKDDPYIPWQLVQDFSRRTGIPLKLLAKGGHMKTEKTVRRFWPKITAFFDAKA